ncbi:hypothetical protein Q8G81_35760, partial [Klebsiella pneumoniae]
SRRQIALKSTVEEDNMVAELNEEDMENLPALLGKFNRFKSFKKIQRRNEEGSSKEDFTCF